MQFVVPPLRDLLGRIVTSLLARLILVLLGYFWIPVEKVSLKRTAYVHHFAEGEEELLTLLPDALLLLWPLLPDAATLSSQTPPRI